MGKFIGINFAALNRSFFNMISFLKIEINKNRIYGLDILRALAILFVVLDHSKYTLQKSNSLFINEISKIYSWYLRYFDFDGVSIFFVLSGFLIGSILIRSFEKEELSFKSLVNFWIKRWVRTLPAYLFVLSILVLLSYFFVDKFNIYETVNIIYLYKILAHHTQIFFLKHGVYLLKNGFIC